MAYADKHVGFLLSFTARLVVTLTRGDMTLGHFLHPLIDDMLLESESNLTGWLRRSQRTSL